MATLEMARFGNALATRERAREVNGFLAPSRSTPDILILDFTGVSAISPSFADELLNVLADRTVELLVAGAEDAVFSVLSTVARRRQRDIRPLNSDSHSASYEQTAQAD